MTNHKFSEDRVQDNIEVFSAYTKGMLESNLEQNRQLLLVSTLAIGFLITFFGIDKLSSLISLVVWGFAVMLFLICTVSTALFFSKNTDHLSQIVEKGSKTKTLKKSLNQTSDIAAISFICGIVLLLVLAICESNIVTKKQPVSAQQIIQIYPFNPEFHHRHDHQEQCADNKHAEDQKVEQQPEVKHQANHR